ncbi:MAG: exosortase C-terminal domain/associated protein EpsI [Syntrophaceae bacterium]
MTAGKRKIWNEAWFRPVALLLLFIAAYWVPIRAMATIWWTKEDYSYALLIPVISAYLLWDKRAVMRTLTPKEDWRVFPALLFFVALSLYGILGSSGNISMPAIPILIILFTAFCFGIDTVNKLRAPLFFLLFLAPVPPIIERYIGIYLKSVSSRIGGLIIDMFNIPVFVSGNVIDLGVTQLQVVDACSGMRYLFALIALGSIYAYFFEKVTWKRIFAIFSTIPIGVAMNGVRIGITGILTDKYGVETAQGFYHMFSGWVFFAMALLCLLVIGRILRLLPPKAKTGKRGKDLKGEDTQNIQTARHTTNRAVLVSVILMFFTGIFTVSTDELPAVKIRGGLQSFPLAFEKWHGHFEVIEARIVRASGAEDAFSGTYHDLKGNEVSLYLGYRSSAFLSNENFFHSPNVCLPSSGSRILEDKTHTLRNVPRFGDIAVDRLIMDSRGTKMLVYFWFQTKDKTTQYKDIHRFHLALHAIKRDNTHDFLIRIMTPISSGETLDNAQERMDDFARDMMTALLKFLKDRQYNDRSSNVYN